MTKERANELADEAERRSARAAMKRYAIEIERDDGTREVLTIVDAQSAPEAHRLYARRLDEERKGKAKS